MTKICLRTAATVRGIAENFNILILGFFEVKKITLTSARGYTKKPK